MKLKQFIFALVAMLLSFVSPAFAQVAKVGNTEYETIDEAIANWTDGTTLTLLADVTLSDVVTLKSTEHHTLDLGTYTMTAASGKNAIEITCEGRSSASYAITVNADATNPGGITATGKACVYYSKSGSTKDRPIIRIYNGVFDGSYSINSKSNGNTNCPQVWIYGGTFNGNVNLTKNMLRVFGGTFNGWINCTGDSSAYREISGGRFKSWQFMTADADNKFWVGTSKANYNVGVYVDDEGYLCVGGPVITEVSAKYPAVASNYSKWSSYLKYSAAATYGLFYEDAAMAIAKHGAANVTVWEPVKAPAVEEIVKPEATEEEKAVVEDVIEEVTNNAAVENYTVELPAEVTNFTIELSNVEVAEGTTPEQPETPATVVTEISYTVTPKNDEGEKVSTPSEPITFRLPLPSNWASEKVKVIYNGTALDGDYTVMTENGAKYVEVESQSFSTYTVKAIVPLESYVQFPAGMDASNYETLFGTNTVTDGTNYYATLQAAVEAVAGQANAVLYCKPGADVGSLQHAPVVSTLTIYGNGANVTGGSERDFDLGNTDPSGGRDITADMTLTVKHLNGCGAWGAKVTSHTVNLVFENCANMGKVFITGTTGTLNITMNDCAFEGVIKEAVYSNADGAITLNNVAFSNLNKAINLNHKAAGTQTVTINGCSFTNCGADVAADQIPVRVLSSVDGGKSVLNVSNTTFTGTPEGGADILLDYAVGETTASVTATAANVFVEKENNVATKTTVTESEGGEFTNVVPVAKVNGIEYATLAEAITAAQNGGTIILIADVKLTAQVVIPEGKVLTLDLNGKTVNSVFNGTSTTNHIYALSNKGTLTIQDSKGNGSINSRGIYNYGSLTLNAGAINAIDGNGGYAVNNQSGSTFVMNGGVVAATNEDDHQSSSGGYDATALKVPAGCTATLNGGTINNVCDFTYAIDAAGTLNIPETSAITVNGTHGAIAVTGGVTTIDAGTFQIPADNYSRTDNVLYVSGGSLVVNGGTFIGDSDTAGGGSCLYDAAGKAVVNGGTFKGSSGGDVWGTTGTTIKGGTFENLTEKQHIAAGYELNADGTVAAKPVASINGTKYTSLSEAVAAAQNGETITLIDNVVLAERVTIPADKTLTIDLNGKSISMEESIIATAYAINNLGNLTITDGVGGGSINARGIYNGYGDGAANVATAKITVVNGTINAKGTNGGGAAIFNYGVADIQGGTFTSVASYAIALQTGSTMTIGENAIITGGINSWQSTLTITGGTISNDKSGKHVVYAGESAVTINGGTFHNNNSGNATIMASGSTAAVEITGGTFTLNIVDASSSYLIDATSSATYTISGGSFTGGIRAQGGTKYEIAGGTFTNEYGNYNVYEGGDINISGGTFTGSYAQTFAKNNIADDYKLGEDGKVVYAPVVVKIGETKYETLDAAFAAATEGQTITMLVDATPALTSQRAITKAAVIDLGGKTLTLTEDDLYFGTTTFKNGTIVVDPSVKPSTAVFWMFANQTLTFDNVKVVATGVTGTYLIGLEGDNSDLNLLNGSEILVENTTALDLDIICVNGTNTCDIKVENSKVNVTNLDGRVFFRGNYTVKDSEVNLAGITKAGFRIEAGQTLSIEGTSEVNIEGEPRDGGIHLTDASANYTKAETATVNATVNEPKVAKIGETTYKTLQAAIEAVQEGETIILVDNVNVTTPAYGQNALNHARAINFTLDLNGKTLSANTGNSVFRFNIANSGATSNVTLTIKNGKIVAGSNTWCAVMASGISSDVKAIMNLENLTIEASKAGDLAVKAWDNATINANNVTVNATNAAGGFYAVGGEIVLDNCTVNQKGLHTAPYLSMAFAVSSNGKMTINSGTYSAEPTASAEGSNQGSTHGSWVGGVMNSGGELIINGGTFSNGNFGDDALATAARGLIFADTNGKVTVNGGTFNALKSIFDFQNNLGGTSPVIKVKGGNYSADPAVVTSYGSIVLDANCVVVENNGVWNVVKAAAKIGEQGYASLQAAFNAVQDGETITLVDNVTISAATAGYTDGTYTDGVRYTGDKSFTVDFNGKTVTDDGCVNDYLIYINNKGEKASEITFTNGTIVSANGCWSAVCVNSSAATQNVELNLNRMNITNSNDAVYSGNPVVRVRTLATVNVNDGTIITSNGASYGVAANTDGSTVNINEGATIVQQNSGTTGGNSVFAAVGGKGVINIKGGTITSDRYGVHTMTTGTPVINISGGTITAPVALKSSTNGGNGELATINVTGGTINGTLEAYTDNGKIVVSGGTFSKPVAEEYCADGFVPAENADGTFGVEKAPVASINGTKYTSLAEAVAAAQAGDEIVLTADVKTTDGVVITDKNLTIDLNGKTYTVTEGANTNNRNFKINGTSVVTVKNGTMVAAGEYSSGAYGTIRTEGTANVTLTGLKLYNYRGNGLNIKACAGTTVTIENTEIYANYGGGIEAAGGTIVINDGVTVKQEGMYTAPYNSMAISVNGGGKVTVNGGTFSTECLAAADANNQGTSHGPWVAGVLNSGGTLIINGGTFSNDNFGDNSLATYARGAILADTKAKVEINGGTFNVLKNVIDIQNNLGDTNNNPSVLLVGGTYSADPRISAQYGSNLITLAENCIAVENNGVWNVELAAAKIGTEYYTSLADAFEAVESEATVMVLQDITLTEKITIAGKVVTLDLNGKTISGTCNTAQSSLIYVENNAALTVKDGSDAKTGKLTYAKGSSDTGWTVDLKGALTLESGTIELTGTDWSIGYAVDVRPNSWGTEYKNATQFTMNGGKLVSSDGAVRVASSSAAGHKDVAASFVMDGGEIEAAWDGVFVQQSDAIYDVLNFTINKGTIKSGLNPVRVYGPAATDYVNGQNCMNLNFNGGTMTYTGEKAQEWVIDGILRVGGGSSMATITESGAITASEAFANANTLPEGYAWEVTAEGNYVAVELPMVAKVGEIEYTTLQSAIDAATEGATVTVLADIVLAETATVPAGKTITLDLNGKTVFQEKACTASYEMILNKGNLTIKNGTISFKDTSAGDPSFGWGSYTVRNEGTLVVEDATIEHLGAQSFATHMICAIFQYSGFTTINGGKISTPNYRSVRLWKGDMTVNDGTFEGQLWVQAVDNTADLAINGGTFAPRGNDGSSVFVSNSSNDVEFNVTGGTFTTKIGCSDATKLAGAITGGLFTETAKNGTNSALIAEHYIFGEADANGYYGVIADPSYIAELTIVDGASTEFVNENDIEVGTLTYVREFVNINTWQAFYVPFEIELTSDFLDNYDVAYFNDIRCQDEDFDGQPDDDNMVMEAFMLKKGKLRANYPYLIRPKTEDALEMNLELYDVVLSKTTETTVTCTSVFMKFELTGVYASKTIVNGDGQYAFTKDGVWKYANTTATIKPFRLILKITSVDGKPYVVSETANIRIRIEGEGDATDIEGVEFGGDDSELKYFDLMGRPVVTPIKGRIYIVNGKKVLY